MTTANAPGAAVYGTGFGLFAHVRALQMAGFEVRAIIGRDLERTKKRAAPLGIPNPTNNLADVLADPKIRLVTVATPPHAHCKPVLEIVAAGRNVVCEKPFAKDLAEARRMLKAATDAGVVHMLGAEFRFDSAQALLRRVVKDGLIGEPKHFFRVYNQPGLSDPNEPLAGWWEDENQGGGFLGAFGSHMIDQVRYTIGEVTDVSAVLQTLARGRPNMTSDDTYSLQFATDNGAKGLIMAAMTSPGPIIMGTKVVGTKGGAWIQSGAVFGDPEQVWVEDKDGTRQIAMPADIANPPPEPFPVKELIQTEMDRWHTAGFDVGPYAHLFAEMKARIEGKEPAIPERAGTFYDAAAVQAVMDAAYQSSKQQRWTKVEKV